jgi:hypothetical protein
MNPSFNAFSSSGISSAALSAALAAKLDKAGGTMTGALTINAGTLATAAFTHQQTWNSAGTTCRGLEIAVTDTNSAAASTLLRLRAGASASTPCFSINKSGDTSWYDSTSGHAIRLDRSSTLPTFTASYSGSDRCMVSFNQGAGYSPFLSSTTDDVLFGRGALLNSPSNSTAIRGYATSFSQLTFTFGATKKDYNGAFTGDGHHVQLTGGEGSSQGTGALGGEARVYGGAAAGSGNNNGGNVVIQGGAPTGSGTRGSVFILNLPTSSAGLPSGALWNDTGTLKIA